MSWIGSKIVAKRPQTPSGRITGKGAPGFATVVAARGVTGANATVEDFSQDQCRLRSVVMFDVNTPVEFQVALPGKQPEVVRGRIVARLSVPPRFVYDVTLDPRPAPPVPPAAHQPDDLSAIDELPSSDPRRTPRLEIEFPVQYRTAKEGFKAGKAGNVSLGGLLMTCGDVLVEGMLVELHFVLPSHLIALKRKRSSRDPARDIVAQARIVRHEPTGNGTYRYGLSFLHLERDDRVEIAHYLDAVRHVKVKKSS